jgi:catechol 2,3-dioxygenase-like lactoylglutathione lyase family enzyme
MTSAIVGLDHVQVAAPAGCEDDVRRFYGVLLGLEELEKPPLLGSRGGVWFEVGEQQLHVGVADDFVPAAKAHPALRVSSREALERLAARLEEHDAVVRWADPEEIPGRARFFVDDPWGNRIELIA